jgi:hypothetical protein
MRSKPKQPQPRDASEPSASGNNFAVGTLNVLAEAVAYAIDHPTSISKREFKRRKAAGLPIVELRAENPRDGFILVAGVRVVGDKTAVVTGKFPAEWAARQNRANPSRGRPALGPKLELVRRIAMHLTTQHFIARNNYGENARAGLIAIGHKSTARAGLRAARILAARRMGAVTASTSDTSAERRFRNEISAMLKSGALAEFDRVFCVIDHFVLYAHRSATIQIHADGVQLVGKFWGCVVGHKEAELRDNFNCFIEAKILTEARGIFNPPCAS